MAAALPASINDLLQGHTLPSSGFGVRYRIAPKNKVNFRVDGACGKESRAIHAGVGEAFGEPLVEMNSN
jgi:hypothetical protein